MHVSKDHLLLITAQKASVIILKCYHLNCFYMKASTCMSFGCLQKDFHCWCLASYIFHYCWSVNQYFSLNFWCLHKRKVSTSNLNCDSSERSVENKRTVKINRSFISWIASIIYIMAQSIKQTSCRCTQNHSWTLLAEIDVYLFCCACNIKHDMVRLTFFRGRAYSYFKFRPDLIWQLTLIMSYNLSLLLISTLNQLHRRKCYHLLYQMIQMQCI